MAITFDAAFRWTQAAIGLGFVQAELPSDGGGLYPAAGYERPAAGVNSSDAIVVAKRLGATRGAMRTYLTMTGKGLPPFNA